MIEALGDDKTPLALGELVGEIAQQTLDVALAEQCRDLANDDGGWTERFNHKSETLKLGGGAGETVGGFGIELDHLGDQQQLSGDAQPAGDED